MTERKFGNRLVVSKLFYIFASEKKHNNFKTMRDKKIFLCDKETYTKKLVNALTEKDLEKLVAEEDYDNNYTIIKIDANSYESVEDALLGEGYLSPKDYYIRSFGIK